VERVVPDPAIAAGESAGSLVPDRNVSPPRLVVASEVRPASDQEEVRSYRLQVAALAAEFKEYPTIARERGWEGVVGIRLRLVPDRPFPEVSLVRSSGVHALDEAALGMIARASRTVDVPRGLRGRLLNVDLPVDYRLD
jgi:protein TonB